jgi:carbon-monoxide dehydrogenase medium subunit
MNPFTYFSPTTIQEAVQILADHESARCLAGGTDLLIRMKRHQWLPRAVVNLKRIPGLREIALNGDSSTSLRMELRLGALVTLQDLIRAPIIREHFPVLAYAASKMAGVQVRSLATVGGNLCNASPAADTAPPLIALNARAVVVGAHGERVIPLDEFFTGVGKSALAPDEILREILVPRDDSVRASFIKLEHREAMDISIVSVAVSVEVGSGKSEVGSRKSEVGQRIPNSEFPIPNSQFLIPSDVRIVLGAVAPTPLRAKRAEEILRGKELTEERIRQAAQVAAREAQPIDDVRSSAWYRREMVEVLTRRQLLAYVQS